MSNNDIFRTLVHLLGLTDKELVENIFKLGGIGATQSKIRGWRAQLDNRRASTMSDEVLEGFFQGLFKYRDMLSASGVQAFNFPRKEKRDG